MEPEIVKTGISYSQFIEQGSCSFYGAPIAIIVTIDRLFPKARYLDVGLSVSYLLLAAHAMGLGACPIGLIVPFADVISEQLDIPEEMEILLAVAMGHPDETSPVNRIKTDREDLSEILRWYE
jgi:nitroreductase